LKLETKETINMKPQAIRDEANGPVQVIRPFRGSGGQESGRLPAGHEDQPEVEELTRRELEILKLIAHGFENHEIAERFVISTETVKSHVRNLRAKLGARNRAHAVTIAFGRRLIRWEPTDLAPDEPVNRTLASVPGAGEIRSGGGRRKETTRV
jgi:DNA-binding NarL/FixJ family response regulator